MARVELASLALGVITDEYLNPLPGRAVTIRNPDGSNATTYTAYSGGSSSSTGTLTSNSDGTLPNWVEGADYLIGYTTPSGTVISRRLPAVSGSVESGRGFGLVGGLATPGGTDDSAVVLAAMAAHPDGGVLVLGEGTWALNLGTIGSTSAGQGVSYKFLGAGPDKTIITPVDATHSIFDLTGPGDASSDYFELDNLAVCLPGDRAYDKPLISVTFQKGMIRITPRVKFYAGDPTDTNSGTSYTGTFLKLDGAYEGTIEAEFRSRKYAVPIEFVNSTNHPTLGVPPNLDTLKIAGTVNGCVGHIFRDAYSDVHTLDFDRYKVVSTVFYASPPYGEATISNVALADDSTIKLTSATVAPGASTVVATFAAGDVITIDKGDVVEVAKVSTVTDNGDGTTSVGLSKPLRYRHEAALSGITGVAATDLLTKTAHGLVAGSRITFSSITGGSGLSAGTTYYVIASGLTANDFKVSTTPGGSAVDFTTDITAAAIPAMQVILGGKCLSLGNKINAVRLDAFHFEGFMIGVSADNVDGIYLGVGFNNTGELVRAEGNTSGVVFGGPITSWGTPNSHIWLRKAAYNGSVYPAWSQHMALMPPQPPAVLPGWYTAPTVFQSTGNAWIETRRSATAFGAMQIIGNINSGGTSEQRNAFVRAQVAGTSKGELRYNGQVVANLLCVTATNKSANYTVVEADPGVFLVDSTSGAITITLLAASVWPKGSQITIKDIAGQAGANAITVARAGSDTIDGATSKIINMAYGSVTLATDASSKWGVVAPLVPRMLVGSATWNPASLVTGASEKKSVTVTGAVAGDVACAGFDQIAATGWEIAAVVIGADTVEVKITNNTAGTVDLGSGTVRAIVEKLV